MHGAVLAGQLDRPGRREVGGVGWRRAAAERRGPPGPRVEPDDGPVGGGAVRHAEQGGAVGGQRWLPAVVAGVEVGEDPRARVQQAQPQVTAPVQDREPAVAENRVRQPAEIPQRPGELLLHRAQRLRRAALKAELVEVPPAGQVGDQVEGLVVLPPGCQDRLRRAALDRPGQAVGQAGEAQLGAVPRHARVVPADVGEMPAVGGDGGEGVEVVAGDVFAGGAAAQRDGDDGPRDLAVAGVPLAYAPDVPVVDEEVGVAGVLALGGERADGAVEQVEALVGEVGEDDLAVRGHGVGAAAVLVHAGAGAPGGGQQLAAGAVGGAMDDGGPAALLGTVLRPPRLPVERAGPARAHSRAGDLGG